MTFEEWYNSVELETYSFSEYENMLKAYDAGYKQAVVDCYGEAAAPLVLESLRKASNRPVEPFSSGGEGKGSQTAVKPCQGGCPQLCPGCTKA